MNIIEKPSFCRTIKAIDPQAPVFTYKTIRNEVENLGEICREALKKELHAKKFSITTDHWTSNNDQTYSCLTAHYIDSAVLKHSMLEFEVFNGSTAGDLLGKDFIG